MPWLKNKSLHKECFDRQKSVLGENDPLTLQVMNDWAYSHYEQDRLEQAEIIFKDCLQRQKSVIGNTHCDTRRTIANLVLTYEAAGKHDQVGELYGEIHRMK